MLNLVEQEPEQKQRGYAADFTISGSVLVQVELEKDYEEDYEAEWDAEEKAKELVDDGLLIGENYEYTLAARVEEKNGKTYTVEVSVDGTVLVLVGADNIDDARDEADHVVQEYYSYSGKYDLTLDHDLVSIERCFDPHFLDDDEDEDDAGEDEELSWFE